jgi:hypothetical protein
MTGTQVPTSPPTVQQNPPPADNGDDGDGKRKQVVDPRLKNVKIPRFTDDVVDEIGRKIDERDHNVIAAAVDAFAQLSTEDQVKLTFEARVKYANFTPDTSADGQ